jgi:DNA invertase Pin-like site-specific DNA recombinase
MRVAIFARVSTTDGRQDNSRQTSELNTLCIRNNWNVVETICEEISGSKSHSDRPGLKRLIALSQSGKIDKVVISEISRIGRNVSDGIAVIDLLTKSGVSIFIQNIGMETLLSDGRTNFMFKPILLTLMGFAEMEREQLRERVKSGLENAKRKGKVLGRPTGTIKTDQDILKQYPAIVKQLRAGRSIRETAKLCDVATGTAQKVKQAVTRLGA